MTTTPSVKQSRVRASERAVTAALKAMMNVGLPVHKLCVEGGHIEIYCHGVEADLPPEEDDGLEKW